MENLCLKHYFRRIARRGYVSDQGQAASLFASLDSRARGLWCISNRFDTLAKYGEVD